MEEEFVGQLNSVPLVGLNWKLDERVVCNNAVVARWKLNRDQSFRRDSSGRETTQQPARCFEFVQRMIEQINEACIVVV